MTKLIKKYPKVIIYQLIRFSKELWPNCIVYDMVCQETVTEHEISVAPQSTCSEKFHKFLKKLHAMKSNEQSCQFDACNTNIYEVYPLKSHENGAPSYMCDWVLVFYTQMTRKKLTWGFPFSCMVSGSTSRPLLIWFPKQLMCNLKLLMSQKGVIENNITDSF